jgi:hypothetical protein
MSIGNLNLYAPYFRHTYREVLVNGTRTQVVSADHYRVAIIFGCNPTTPSSFLTLAPASNGSSAAGIILTSTTPNYEISYTNLGYLSTVDWWANTGSPSLTLAVIEVFYKIE